MNIHNFVRLIQGLVVFSYQLRCPRPVNRGVCLIEVVFVGLMQDSIRDSGNCPLNTGCPLNGGPLYTGFTVCTSKGATRNFKRGSFFGPELPCPNNKNT